MTTAKADKKLTDKDGDVPGHDKNSSPQLMAYAKGRTARVVARVGKAMKAIELDIEANEGLYPLNGGRVTQAEVCRRAGIRNATLQGSAHKVTTKATVDAFVERVRRRSRAGYKSVRREVSERADYWKRAHGAVADAYHIDSLRFEEAQVRIRSLQEEHAKLLLELEASIRVLEEENRRLRRELASAAGSKIVPMRKPKIC
ncbi:hypothetical protein [Burkholderia contaminans]|uniref:hypothetical protein n=1 Tax=Burkholderia contaminans TaxID=488447 RepID=UPI001582C65E|nr:hypothetical protein [Burkholderia contaminans]